MCTWATSGSKSSRRCAVSVTPTLTESVDVHAAGDGAGGARHDRAARHGRARSVSADDVDGVLLDGLNG
jgi:hypothetical protein